MALKKIQRSILSSAVLLSVFPIQPIAAEENIPIPTPNSRKEIKSNDTTLAPVPKPRTYQSACPAVLLGKVIAKTLPEISDNQCGERSPLEVQSIAGISFASDVILNCRMATSLVEWVEKTKVSAKTILKDELISISNSTSYDCRKRRGSKQNKISEHAFANAFDVSGFKFKSKESVSVLNDWQSEEDEAVSISAKAEFLTSVRDAACTHFTTVLSPETNAAHEDHFHFDLGCHGKKCTYKICD